MLIQCGALDAIKTLSSTLISGLFVLSRVPLNSARKLSRLWRSSLKAKAETEDFCMCGDTTDYNKGVGEGVIEYTFFFWCCFCKIPLKVSLCLWIFFTLSG